MRTVENLCRLLALIGFLGAGRAVSAQPTIPKGRIPSGISAEVRQHVEELYSADPRQRAIAATQLLGKPEEVAPAIPFLIAMLHDNAVLHDEAQLRRLSMISSYARVFSFPNTPGQQAAETVARIGRRAGKPIVDALIVPLRGENQIVRANAIRALGEMLQGASREEREGLVAGRVVGPLLAALKADEANVRKYASVVLEQLGAPRATGPLLAVLQEDQSEGVRVAAAAALGALKDPRSVGPLIAVLENLLEPAEVRMEAAESLGKIGDLRAVAPLTRALKDEDWRVRGAALTVADLIRDFRVLRPLLIDALQDEQWRVRARAARTAGALYRLKDPQALAVLFTALTDEQPNVRARAAETLAETRDPRVLTPLAAVLREDKNSYVRRFAAGALGELEDSRAVVPLTAALRDENELVRTTARRSLQKIKKAEKARQI